MGIGFQSVPITRSPATERTKECAEKPPVPAAKDLAPTIYRQRLVIEGYPSFSITDVHIRDYLARLSEVAGMKALIAPVTHRSEKFGWAGWIHWETSGAHFYAWDVPRLFFSADIYTCKAFDPDRVALFTQTYFKCTEQTHKEF